MASDKQGNIMAIMTSVEMAIMRRGNTNYNLVTAKLNALYECSIMDCYEHPEYLRKILQEVFLEDYSSIIEDVKSELDYLVDIEEEKTKFFKVMES